MEDIRSYIESGILELYILGDLTEKEVLEVEKMAAKHPEIKEELAAIELAMEEYAKQHAVIPNANLEDRILQSIDPNIKKDDAKVLPLYPDVSTADPKLKLLRISLAACIGLLIVSLVALYSAYHQLDAAKDQLATLSLENQKFAATVNFMKQNNQELREINAMIDNPNWAVVKLGGTDKAPSAKMMVYWNKESRSVMVDNSKMSLPDHDAAHQYQLWAVVDGKPVDLGVFDLKSDSPAILRKMKAISSAQAFAVTLEKRGGSPTPNMNQMVVIGNVSI